MSPRPTASRIKLTPSQWRKLTDRTSRFILDLGGVRSGKTTSTALIVQRELGGDTSQRGAIFANTYQQLINVVLHEVTVWLERANYREGRDYIFGQKPPAEWVSRWRRLKMETPAPTLRNYNQLIFRDKPLHVICGSLGGKHWKQYVGLTLAWWVIEELLEGIEERALRAMMERLSCGVGADECAARHHHLGVCNSNTLVLRGHWIFRFLREIVEPANVKRLAAGQPALWTRIQSSTYENVANVGEEFIQSILDSSDAEYAAKALTGDLSQLVAGLAYSRFDAMRNVIPIAYHPERDVEICFDFNADPAVCALTQRLDASEVPESLRSGKQCVGVFGEYYRTGGQSIEDTARLLCEGRGDDGKLVHGLRAPENFKGLRSHNAVVRLYADATGNARNVAAIDAGSALKILRSVLRENLGQRFRNCVPRSNPAVLHRVHAMNAMLCSASGISRLFIAPWCSEIRADFEEISMTEDGADLDKSDKKRTHISDSLGYRIYAEFPPAFSRGSTTDLPSAGSRSLSELEFPF